MERRTEYTDKRVDTGNDQLSDLETMPVASMRQSTSQSGVVSHINIGSRSSDTSDSVEDTEDEVIYLGTHKPDSGSDDSDTTHGVEKPSTVVKTEYHLDTSGSGDNNGFTPVLTRYNRRKKSQPLPHTPTPDRKSSGSQIPRKPDNSSTAENPLPAEIRITDHHTDDYSHMEEPLHFPVQVDTLTEILQERLQPSSSYYSEPTPWP